MSVRLLLLSILIGIAAPLGTAQALMLDTWNVDELQASDDYINIDFGTTADGNNTTITLSWVGGVDDTSGALGVDKLFINNSDSSLEVIAVYVNSIVAGNDVTSSWLPTNGGQTAGGGFGTFVEKVADSASRDGIDPNSLIFVLNGLYTEGSFSTNANAASFAAHVRYDNDCSGWASDSGAPGGDGSDSSCGGSPVPEPSAALAFAAGAIVVSSAVRRRR